MKHDSKTHIDRQERLIGMTAKRISRPDKVCLPPYFLFLRLIANALVGTIWNYDYKPLLYIWK